ALWPSHSFHEFQPVATEFPSPFHLVIAAPQRNAGMVAQALHLLDHLLPDILLKGRISRDHGAAEHEILPDHDAQFIANVIEVVRLVVASAPVPDHVHVSIARRLQNLPMLRGRDTSHEAVEWNYIRT